MKSVLENVLQKNQSGFRAVVDFNAATEKIAPVNLSRSNTELTEEIYSNTKSFSAWVDAKRKESDAKFLIGGLCRIERYV